MGRDLSAFRENYQLGSLERKDLKPDPFQQFQWWMDQAIEAEVKEANAFSLATIRENGFPDNRIVLLKEITTSGFLFYTNYKSAKGRAIEQNPKVAMNFWWKDLQRQVRIQGMAEKVSFETSERYFHSRPYGSQIGALSSHQSTKVENRDGLERRYEDLHSKYESEGKAPLSDHWGGYLIKPAKFEFWQGRSSRLHDRFEFVKEGEQWSISRLEP